MSIDLHHPSSENVTRLTKLLSRRPEYGIAIPSRRWHLRQGEKIKNLPDELLHNSGVLKRLFIKIAEKVNPEAVDPRAVLCKTHSVLNPWLIRRFFLAVAYEVTVHTDVLRSWKGKNNHPILAAFVGRVDSIAALWTDPDLYRECYGTPPFESHMIFVQSGCEACILGAMGANARVLADLRTTLIDRTERRSSHSSRSSRSSRPSRSNKRRTREPKLKRYVDEWIKQLTEERAAQCIAMSDSVLEELRKVRPQLKEWRLQRRKELNKSNPAYTELRKTSDGGTELRYVEDNKHYTRRTRNGIPVAVADLEGAEDQRRAALYSLKDNVKSLYRPDSLSPYSEFGEPTVAGGPLPSINEEHDLSDDYEDPEDPDDLDDLNDLGDHPDLDRDFEAEERSRLKVTQWYSSQVSKSDLTPDDTRTVLSMAHPAFRPPADFSHMSAAPSPLNIRRYRSRSAPSIQAAATDSVWTDVTVYTADNLGDDAPPVPEIPSQYRRNSTNRLNNNDGDGRPPRTRSPTRRPATALGHHRPSQNPRQSTSSSVYSSDQRADAGSNLLRRFLTGESEVTVTRGTRPRNRTVGDRDTQGYTAILPHRSRFASSVPDLPSPERDSHDHDHDDGHSRSNERGGQNHDRSHRHHHRHHHGQDHGSSSRHRSHTRDRGGSSHSHSHSHSHSRTRSRSDAAAGSRSSSRTRAASPCPEDEDDGLAPEDSHSVAFWRQPR
ncbi:hypothetical protein F5Y00DRAFT_22150 [Daldinia vernicosa]|uniref:uncharacterized protein n=1 Tax=Daldinia vernicosa TaxID=114800 RepID=UPI002008D58D|nr:uncharacterized protein F5Y00DRAFT_22150 [Daldinia vernicosa]KAI0850919.1 hypothetical protein F5Y00DRAFT_22150 [Daldinia vernicosa]